MPGAINMHIVGHLIVGIGAILLFIAAFFGNYRRAPFHIRLLLFLIGPVGVAWSMIGIYLIDHTTAQDHITLPWAQFWMLSHTKPISEGLESGSLLALGINPEFYGRQRCGTLASKQPLGATAGQGDAHI